MQNIEISLVNRTELLAWAEGLRLMAIRTNVNQDDLAKYETVLDSYSLRVTVDMLNKNILYINGTLTLVLYGSSYIDNLLFAEFVLSHREIIDRHVAAEEKLINYTVLYNHCRPLGQTSFSLDIILRTMYHEYNRRPISENN